jgi:hypothetical protein
MSRYLSLHRNCLGLDTRIECAVLPVEEGNGIWVLICAAGMSSCQPTEVKANGPFYGACAAEAVIQEITYNLQAMGYKACLDMPIWRLHIQAELRRISRHSHSAMNKHQGYPEP